MSDVPGFEIKTADGKPLDDATRKVLDAIAAAMSEGLPFGKSLAEHVADWNAEPLERRKMRAAMFLRAHNPPGDEIAEVTFDYRGEPGEANVEIMVNLQMSRSIEQVYFTATVERPES